MESLSQLTHSVQPELDRFEALLLEAVKNEYYEMGYIVSELLNLKGKRMRPLLTILAAKMFGEVTEKHLAGAVIMEITHNASLIHDDVIDEAFVRRGEPTLNAHLSSKGAVLAGDFVLACGIEMGVKYGNFRAIEIAARTLKQLVEGELQQAKCAKGLTTTKKDYYNIINLKTAYLLAASAEVGVDGENAKNMYRFGELIGQAYQIKDDILDYVGSGSGKEMYNDVRERKITLPLLEAFDLVGGRDEIIEVLQSVEGNEEAVGRVVDFVKNSGAIELCQSRVEDIKQEALQILDKYPQSDAKNGLRFYCEFVTKREY